MVEEVVLALDADSAGQEAMLRAQRVAAGRRMRLRVAAMPAGVDPAEMMAEDGGGERFHGLLDAAVELTAFQVGLVLDRTDVASPVGRDRALEEVAPVLAGMGESASRDDLVRRVADRLGLDPAMVMGRVVASTPTTGGVEATRSTQGERAGGGAQRPPGGELTAPERWERGLLMMCIARPEEGREYLDRLTDAHLSALGRRAAVWLRSNLDDPATGLPQDDPELASLISELVLLSREESLDDWAMEHNFLRLEERRLEAELVAAGERGDYERRASLSRERAALVDRIAHAQRVES
jgi:DNA primase